MIGWDAMKHGTLAATVDTTPLAFVLSECIALDSINESEALTDCHMLELLVAPSNNVLLFEITFSAELDALLIDSSLDDFTISFSRSSSLWKKKFN